MLGPRPAHGRGQLSEERVGGPGSPGAWPAAGRPPQRGTCCLLFSGCISRGSPKKQNPRDSVIDTRDRNRVRVRACETGDKKDLF